MKMIERNAAIRAALHNEGQAVVAAIEELPVTELIRCKDCRYFERIEPGHPTGYCNAAKHGFHSSRWDIGIYRLGKEDFYCGDAEKEGEE